MSQRMSDWPSTTPVVVESSQKDSYSAQVPNWKGNLFVGSLKFGFLDRIELSEPFGGRVVRETRLLADGQQRVRDVRQGPDGLLYVLTDSANGRLLRLRPD